MGQNYQNSLEKLSDPSYQEWFELFQASWKFYFMKWFSLNKLFYAQKPWFLIGFFKYFAKWARKVWKNSKMQLFKTFPWKTSLQLTPPATVCLKTFQNAIFFLIWRSSIFHDFRIFGDFSKIQRKFNVP